MVLEPNPGFDQSNKNNPELCTFIFTMYVNVIDAQEEMKGIEGETWCNLRRLLTLI